MVIGGQIRRDRHDRHRPAVHGKPPSPPEARRAPGSLGGLNFIDLRPGAVCRFIGLLFHISHPREEEQQPASGKLRPCALCPVSSSSSSFHEFHPLRSLLAKGCPLRSASGNGARSMRSRSGFRLVMSAAFLRRLGALFPSASVLYRNHSAAYRGLLHLYVSIL